MRLSVKKVIEFVTVAVAAIGVIILITSLQKFRNRTTCLRCNSTLTKSYEIPYHVWIQWKGRYECSGTVIHNRHILTPAHCVVRSVENADYNTTLKVISLSRTLNHGLAHDVEKIILHPSYDGHIAYKHDIALIRLTKILYGFDAKRVAIPISEERMTSHEGLELFVTGFGKVVAKNAFVDYDQHKFYMKIISMERCKKLFSDVDLSGKFCAIAASGYEPCLSDIGSPATTNKTHLIGMYIGFKECFKYYAELFIDVMSYSDFIKSSITTA